VVFSAVITYLTVAEHINWQQLLALRPWRFPGNLGCQRLLTRSLKRTWISSWTGPGCGPCPPGYFRFPKPLFSVFLSGIAGTVLLWVFTNPLCGILGFISMVLYAVVYTPLKRVTPFSVFIGAFPGAIPTMIGGVAATSGFGEITFFTLLLFMIQFVWQFPHFWSLAWFYNDDYAKADFHLLPSKGGKDDFSKFQILLYAVFLLLVSILPFVFQFTGLISTGACVICGLALLLQAYNFYRLPTDEQAKKAVLCNAGIFTIGAGGPYDKILILKTLETVKTNRINPHKARNQSGAAQNRQTLIIYWHR